MMARGKASGEMGETTGPYVQSPDLHGFLEGGIRARDRRHGDPFPLPRPKQFSPVNEFAEDPERIKHSLHLRLMDEAVKAVNGLASASLNSKRELRHDRSPDPSLGTTAVQDAMLRDMQVRLQDFVDSKCDFDENEALTELWDPLTCMSRRPAI